VDELRFDNLTRMLTTSRRGSLKTLLGIALGMMLITRDEKELTAACKKVGENCEENNDCCDGATCTNGKCKCKTDRTECNGKCYNLDKDEDHCGSCDIACTSVETCCASDCVDLQSDGQNCGSCGVACGAGETCCSACVDLQSDRDNCGSCGTACAFDETCRDAECVRIGQVRCFEENATDCNGDCVALQSDRTHCGACGNACATGTRCCSGACVDVKSDVNHCGACGNSCAEHETCCDGGCSNLGQLENCGACGYHCPDTAESCKYDRATDNHVCCFAGEFPPGIVGGCEPHCCDTEPQPDCAHCPRGMRCCKDACVAVDGNRDHCGACGHACDDTAICSNGVCISCPPGRVVCDNQCCFP
jgi:hypothetical protein